MCKVILPISTVCEKITMTKENPSASREEIRSIEWQRVNTPATQVYAGTIKSMDAVLLFNIAVFVGTVSWFDLLPKWQKIFPEELEWSQQKCINATDVHRQIRLQR